MPPRKFPRPLEPVRRSERIRVRKEAAQAAAEARDAELVEQRERGRLTNLPRLRYERNRGVSGGGGVTRRTRTRRRNMAYASSLHIQQMRAMDLFGRFMDGIFEAARGSYTGVLSEGQTTNPIREEQTTQSQDETEQEVIFENDPVTEELDLIVSMNSSDSDQDLI
ncbi:hypothetical protein KR200_002816 [Drosophila serrata]|nr:hypothetical protein KR200_002816 [Drosophila serrata]